MIVTNKSLQYCDRLQSLSLQSLENRRNRGDIILVFKILQCFKNKQSAKLFYFRNDKRLKEYILFIQVLFKRIKVRKFHFSIRIVTP